jgi:predicted nucleotidyltransferase
MSSTLTHSIDPSDVETLRSWAEQCGDVRRVWIFGSRVKGTAQLDSDLDVAVEPVSCDDDWCEHQAQWRQQLEGRTRCRLDLWEYKPGRDTRLEGAIAEASALLYEVPPNPSLERP